MVEITGDPKTIAGFRARQYISSIHNDKKKAYAGPIFSTFSKAEREQLRLMAICLPWLHRRFACAWMRSFAYQDAESQ